MNYKWRKMIDQSVLRTMRYYDMEFLDSKERMLPFKEALPCEDNTDCLCNWLTELFNMGRMSKNEFNYFRKVLHLKPVLPKVEAGINTSSG